MANGSETSSTVQRLLIGAATLVVIVLTVAAAIFLALPSEPDEGPPTVEPVTVTTVVEVPATETPTPVPQLPSQTASPTPSQQAVETDEPAATNTPISTATATATATATPVPPTQIAQLATPTRQVVIVTATPVPATATSDPCAPPQGWVEYVVRPGDTLSSLARNANISQTDLQQINCLASSVLQPGQAINLPFTPSEPTATNTTTSTPNPTSIPPSTSTPIAPIIDDVNASAVAIVDPDDDKEIVVIAVGRNFRPREAGFRAELTGPTLIRLDVDLGSSNTSIRGTKLVSDSLISGLSPGTYDLIITNPDGRSDIANGVFPQGTPTPTPVPPSINTITPDDGPANADVIIIITGERFEADSPGFQVEFVPRSGGVSLFYSPFTDRIEPTSTSFEIRIPANDLNPGLYDVKVLNPNGGSDTEFAGYTAT